ncbi:DUF2207 domain-containing protein [Candidatus Uhrbacteria bacterium UHB]|nr:DUF2207 domain-containing protein [Candidatus Uhrbacteria bacterium UHB]RIL00751.1 MAG: hypothetical protein DCC77_04420 [Candidatus Uhrbacteria bacterium]
MNIRRLFLLLPLFAVLFSPMAATAAGETIRDFQVTAAVAADRTLTVTERITYDFGDNERHGIYRIIPTAYERYGGKYNLRLEATKVLQDGKPAQVKEEHPSGNIKLRIGDPDAYVTGAHVYTITYRTNRAINFFDGEGELYWNVTGNGWEIPIERASVQVTGPKGYDATSASTTCFTGVYGSTERACSMNAAGDTVEFSSTRLLRPAEGLTIALRFPKGMIAEPTRAEIIWQIVADNGVLFVPVFVLFFMFFRWRKRGKEPDGRGTVVPQYEPPYGLSPMEMTGLMRQDIPHEGITATLLDLARKGYLKIEFGEEKRLFKNKQTYAFVRKMSPPEDAPSFERELFDGIFGDGEDRVELEELKGSFYKDIQKAKDQVFEALRDKDLFGESPGKVRGTYFIAGGAVAAIPIFLSSFYGFSAIAFASFILSGAIIAAFGWFMPQKTVKGAEALEEVEGFKWFLSVTEKDRMSFHNAPKLKPETFHAYLPYAIAFGVEREWAEQFKGMQIPEPEYATGYGAWNAAAFANSMHALDAQAASAAYAAPSSAGSGGSGFGGGGSGGGFGGGGGGSW